MVTEELVTPVRSSDQWNAPLTVSVSVNRDGGKTIVGLRGELDLATAPILDERLRFLKGQAGELVYDLADLTFIDIFGLRSLLDYGTSPRTRVSIQTPSRQLRRLLEIIGLESIIDELPV
jgi:anti-anti-sigma factor